MRGLLKFIYRLDKSWDHCDSTIALYWYIGPFPGIWDIPHWNRLFVKKTRL